MNKFISTVMSYLVDVHRKCRQVYRIPDLELSARDTGGAKAASTNRSGAKRTLQRLDDSVMGQKRGFRK